MCRSVASVEGFARFSLGATGPSLTASLRSIPKPKRRGSANLFGILIFGKRLVFIVTVSILSETVDPSFDDDSAYEMMALRAKHCFKRAGLLTNIVGVGCTWMVSLAPETTTVHHGCVQPSTLLGALLLQHMLRC
jgi:hypothetical protein